MSKGYRRGYKNTKSRKLIIESIVAIVIVLVLVVGGYVYVFGREADSQQGLAIDFSGVLGLVDEVKGRLSVGPKGDIDIPHEVVLTIGVVSDSHGYTESLGQAIHEMKGVPVDVILHLGDFSAGGELESFTGAREELDASNTPYAVIPGDHDFNWFPEHSRENYETTFGESYNQAFIEQNVGIILFENSIQDQLDIPDLTWLRSTIDTITSQADIVLFFSARPL